MHTMSDLFVNDTRINCTDIFKNDIDKFLNNTGLFINSTASSVNVSTGPITSQSPKKWWPLIMLCVIGFVENVAISAIIIRKNIIKRHAIYIAIISLSISDSIFCLSIGATIGIVLYRGLIRGQYETVSPFLCTAVYFINFLVFVISISQLLLISVMRLISICSIRNMNNSTSHSKKLKTVIVVVFIWIILTTGGVIAMTVDNVVYDAKPHNCRFADISNMLERTNIYILVMIVLSYSLTLGSYVLSVYTLLRVHLHRNAVRVAPETQVPTLPNTSCVSLAMRTAGESDDNSSKGTQERTTDGKRVYATSRRPEKRNSAELIATLILGCLIATHSATILPLMWQLILRVQKLPTYKNQLWLCTVSSVFNALLDPFIFVLSIPNLRGEIKRRCLAVCFPQK